MRHKGLPFAPLDFLACVPGSGIGQLRTLASVDEPVRIPIAVAFALGELIDHGVTSDATKPVFGVAKVGFSTVHDAVPKAALRRVDALADRVTAVQIARQQPQSAGAKSCS